MTASMMNGRQRKTLGEEIARLESLLDGLADGLNEAVADAVGQAVRAVLTEILSNPELVARVAAAHGVTPAAESRPNRWLSSALNAVRDAVGMVGNRIASCRALLSRACRAGWKKSSDVAGRAKRKAYRFLIVGGCVLAGLRRFVGPVLAGMALGGTTGVAGSYLGPWIAGGVSAAGGMGIALCSTAATIHLARLWLWCRGTE